MEGVNIQLVSLASGVMQLKYPRNRQKTCYAEKKNWVPMAKSISMHLGDRVESEINI